MIQEAYPKKYDHFNKDSYPSTGRPQGQISTWDLIKKTAKTHQEKKEIRGILHREYKKDKTRLEPDELRMIYKHPDQLKAMSEIKAQELIPGMNLSNAKAVEVMIDTIGSSQDRNLGTTNETDKKAT